MKIFFDLDGTLLNSMERLYRLFQHLVPGSELSFDEYWNFKRNKTGHAEILKNRFAYSQEQITRFEQEWLGLIEAPEWLLLDKPFDDVTEWLQELYNRHELYLVTARQFEEKVLSQVKEYGWQDLFTAILVTGRGKEKYALIKENISIDADDWFVGDTGKDVQTGKALGLKTCAVLSGFLNKEKLEEYKPDIIINTVLDFKPRI